MARTVLTRNLLVYLGSRFAGGSAMTMLRAGVAWHVFALTDSAFHLGLIGLVQFVPALALTLVGGAVADAYDRRRVMMLAQTVSFCAGTGLLLATVGGAVSLPLLYGVVAVVAAAAAFDSPARMALLPTLVERSIFPRVVTLASTNQALAFATGPFVGGVLIAAFGIGALYAAYAVLLAVSVGALAVLRPGPSEATRGGLRLRAIQEGLQFVWTRQVVLGCMTLDMFAVIFGGASALLPIYATDVLAVGPRGYGLLASSFELGAIASALLMTVLPPVRHAGRALLLAVAGFGVATIIFGLSRSFPLSVVAYALVGAADQVSVVMRSTTVQLATPDALRGRVSAVSMLFIQASNQLGAAESGFLAALTTATFSVVSGGVASLLVVAVIAATMPQLRRYRVESAA